MEYMVVGLILAMLVWVGTWFLKRKQRKVVEFQLQLPPGPTCWPVVGNIFQLGWSPHESFAQLARKHGPIMTLWLGSMCTVVISSSEVARDMFKNHDLVLAGRKIYEAMKDDYGHEGSLITSQYGSHWKMLRRLSTTEFFVTSRLEAMQGVRSKCIDRMVHFIEEAGGSYIDIGRFFFLMAFNLIGNLIFSKDLLDPESERGQKFFYHARKVMELAGKPNAADFLPFLRWLDPQGIKRESQSHIKLAFEIAGCFIKERMETCRGSRQCADHDKRKKDFLDVLLEFREEGVKGTYSFSPRTINVIVFEMFTAGTDTTTSTLEWAMAELLHNPRTLQKVQAELRSKIEPNKKLEEKDIEDLPYLKAVIKETLRLHPPLPFLVPHMAIDSCKMRGYYIPKETQVLVNVWAIGRDPNSWEDPLTFRPERFMEGNKMDYRGHQFEFIPFGSGRRMCPAVPLASRVLPLALGSILHAFDWVLPDGVKPRDMDMSEKMGITLRKALPLRVIPVPYRGQDAV